MFRSGRLTRRRLDQVLRWVEKLPHNLKAVAKACQIYPADLMAWYAAGQDPDCRDPLMAELAWRVAEIRGDKAAQNYQRLETLAGEGHFQAIDKLEQLSAASPWEISPNMEQADELHKLMSELTPMPLLLAGGVSELASKTSDGTDLSPEQPENPGNELTTEAGEDPQAPPEVGPATL